jgi:hypothetical protein
MKPDYENMDMRSAFSLYAPRVLTYRPELMLLTDRSVVATILLQQLIYWADKSDWKPFYKYMEAPASPTSWYKEGDSFTEDMLMDRKRITRARSKIALRVKKAELQNFDPSDEYLVRYAVTREGLTFYAVDMIKIVRKMHESRESQGQKPRTGQVDQQAPVIPPKHTPDIEVNADNHSEPCPTDRLGATLYQKTTTEDYLQKSTTEGSTTKCSTTPLEKNKLYKSEKFGFSHRYLRQCNDESLTRCLEIMSVFGLSWIQGNQDPDPSTLMNLDKFRNWDVDNLANLPGNIVGGLVVLDDYIKGNSDSFLERRLRIIDEDGINLAPSDVLGSYLSCFWNTEEMTNLGKFSTGERNKVIRGMFDITAEGALKLTSSLPAYLHYLKHDWEGFGGKLAQIGSAKVYEKVAEKGWI